MPFNQQIGRLGKVFIGNEGAGTYGTAATLVAGDAWRHLEVRLTASNNRANSEERRGTPGLLDRFSRHITAGFDARGYLSPSGTIGTAPEAKKLLKAGMGVEHLSAGTTTVASGASSTVFTVQAGQGASFTLNRMIVIRRVANSSKAEPRLITNIATDTITVAPALGGTPASGDTVKGGVTYTFANDLPNALTIAKYLSNISHQLNGAAVQSLGITFDGNGEVMLRASGPGKEKIRPAQAQPGTFTTIGSPVTGIVGGFLFNGTAYKITNFDWQLDNAQELVNDTFGTDRAEDMYREGMRLVTLGLNARQTDDVAVVTAAEAAGDNTLLVHAGNTEGKIVGIYCPRAEFDIPDEDDPAGAIRWTFRGMAKETVGNDESYLFTC